MATACDTCGARGCGDPAHIVGRPPGGYVVALAGNPNVGKTSVFNTLTGLRQHTGNWPGKTVLHAEGAFTHNDHAFTVVDLPGTYSLSAHSADEEVARDFICFSHPDVTVVVVDATALERNLNLALQVTEMTDSLILCVNLLDEARRRRIEVDLDILAAELGVPVVGTVARTRRGIRKLKDTIDAVATGRVSPRPRLVRYPDDIETAVNDLMPHVEPLVGTKMSARWVALRLLEGDEETIARIAAYLENPGVSGSLPTVMNV